MATYKQPCVHCGELVDRDSRICPKCSSYTPFGYQCPTCLKAVEKGQALCSGCGRALYIACPTCGRQTFVDVRCEACGAGLMVRCDNKRCGELQFFENTKCTACGKKLKPIRKK